MLGEFIRRFLEVDDWINATQVEFDKFLNTNYQENLNLEYKGQQFLTGKGSKIGKAISGFSNSEGGLLIIGIEEKEPDTSSPPMPGLIQPMSDTKESIQQKLSACVNPWPKGLVIHPIEYDAQGRIFLIDVPGNQYPPVQVTDTGAYYFRLNFQNEPMPAYLVQQAYGKRLFPKLSPELELLGICKQKSPKMGFQARGHIYLKNEGAVAATKPFVELTTKDRAILGIDSYCDFENSTPPSEGKSASYACEREYAVYSYQKRRIGSFNLELTANSELTVRVACLESPIQDFIFRILEDDLSHEITRKETHEALGKPYEPRLVLKAVER